MSAAQNSPELLLDAHLSRKLCRWIREEFGLPCVHASDAGLRQSEDEDIFFSARRRLAIVLSKDIDFVTLLDRHGPPPNLIYITCGNTHNSVMREILKKALPDALAAIAAGEPMVEIGNI